MEEKKAGIQEAPAKNGTEWISKTHPADSPHRNGAAETAVCIVKRALQNIGQEAVFSYSEFQMALQITANLGNKCPVDAKVQSQEDFIQYVIPNTLQLGQASQIRVLRTSDFTRYPYTRLCNAVRGTM